MDHPMTEAKKIADAIRNDPVAASQVKEFISHETLIELLGLGEALDSTTSRAYRAGYDDGQEDGYASGHSAGYAEGRRE
jgi:flagellar biosynthesis/type III secretory pathway protein FliH